MMKFDLYKEWSSHLPVLIALTENTSGPILELGTGVFSTPYLHWTCRLKQRILVSYENNPACFIFANQYKDPRFHLVNLVESWDDCDLTSYAPWDVVLVDHDPAGRRATEVEQIAQLANYVILHDSEPENTVLYGYDKVYDMFKYRFDYVGAGVPHTTIVSNTKNLDKDPIIKKLRTYNEP